MIKTTTLIVGASLLLAGCGVTVESTDLSHGYKFDIVSDNRDLTVYKAGFLFSPEGEHRETLGYAGSHPGVDVAGNVIRGAAMVGAARAQRPDNTNLTISGVSGSSADNSVSNDSETNVDSNVSSENVNASSSDSTSVSGASSDSTSVSNAQQTQGQAQGQLQGQSQESNNTNTNVNSNTNELTGGDGGDNCFPPGQCR